MTTPFFFKTAMINQLVKTLKPEVGDFFLTVSETKANKAVRSMSGSKYGHGILYLGSRPKKMIKTRSGKMLGFPAQAESYCVFELPLQCTGLGYVLNKDKCSILSHISPKSLTKAQKDKLLLLCTGFAAAKYVKGNDRAGYSDRMAYVYGIIDTYSNKVGDIVIPQEYNPTVIAARGLSKVLNGAVQSAVKLSDGYPNLNCTSLITWLYKEIGVPITTFSTTTSPADLYSSAKSNASFVLKEYKFNATGPVPI